MNLRDELLAVRERHGWLTPEAVVGEARSPQHPLHHEFEWDDAIAAHEHRLEQARELIRSVRITYTSAKGPVSIRAFHSLPSTGPSKMAYDPVEEIVENPVSREMLLREMDQDWKRFKAKYQHLKEFASLVSVL